MKKKVNILHIRTCKDTKLLSVLHKEVRHDSHLTHINGWFDFGSTWGYDWTSKMMRVAAVVMMIVMCIGGSQAWGQTDKHGKANCNAAQPVLEVWDLQDASVSATPVERTSPNGEKIYGAYDINVYKDGREWQPAPEQPALVTMTDPGFVDGKMYDVYHEGKEGLEFVATVVPENGTITFPAHSFSVYIVAESGDYARLKVTFHRADNTTVTIYVKPADIDQGFFDRIVYNPDVGTVPSGQQFRGWIDNASYTAANASQGLTFAMVRDSLRNRLAAGVTDGTELHFYAMLFKSYTVSYLDERGVVLATSDIPFLASEGTPAKSYTVSAAYTPPDNSQKFEGWKVREGRSNITPSAEFYTNGTSITIRGDVVFYDTISEGHWLVFNENGKGAKYNAPQFVPADSVTHRPVADGEMTRFGYTFGGWYTDQACTTTFTFGNELTANTTIYAKWNPQTTAPYTVIIWKQNVDGNGYDFEEVISLTGDVDTRINTVSRQGGNGNNSYARVNGTDKRYTGFRLDSFDQNVTINTEGNAVVNVYYKRNEYTLTFQSYSGGWFGRWNTVYTITALYGASIGDNFPITASGVSDEWRWSPQNSTTFENVLVYIDVMPAENVTFRRDESSASTRYMEFYVEALPGQTVARTFNGRSFVKYGNTITAKYNFFTEDEDFVDLAGCVKYGSDPAFTNHRADVNAGGTLYLYYTRETYTINFMDGAYYDGDNTRINTEMRQIREASGIAYGADISSYNNSPEATPEGYVFEGWYSDAICTQPFNFNKMPQGGVTVYAKWRQIQYRVFLHPNADHVTDLDWGSDDQGMSFRVAYGNTISTPTGRSDDYEFAGWFTDAACTQPFNTGLVLNETTVTTAYNKQTDYTDPMDEYGNIGSDPSPYNSDLTGYNGGERFWITKKYELYGKWRAKLRGADGITVVFDCNGGSTSSTATYQYQDNVHAVARDACTPPANKEFSHWVLQSYNGSSYEDVTGSRIYPGAPFTVLKANSKVENARWCVPGNSSDCISTTPGSTVAPDAIHTDYRADYTVKLRAEYVDIESPSYTFIIWYKNDGTGTVVRTDGTGRANPSLGINVTDPPSPSIPAAPTRAGYTFKGWYKKNITGSSIPDTVKQCTPNFLYYNSENGKYYKEAGFSNEVTKVAADIYQPDDYLYAIWEPVVDFNIPAICRGQHITLPTENTGGVTLTGDWRAASGTIPTGTTDYTPPATGNDTLTFTPNGSSYPSSCASAKNFPVTVNQLYATIVIGN